MTAIRPRRNAEASFGADDHVYRMDYGDLLAFHRETGADVTLACQPVPAAEARNFGIMTVDRHLVRDFEEKPQDVAGKKDFLASMGIYVFNAELLRELLVEDAVRQESTHDFGRDLIPRAVRSAHIRVCAHRFRDPCTGGTGFWRDIGTVDAYWRANMELLEQDNRLDLHDTRWRIWTAPERSLPTYFWPESGGLPTLISSAIVGNGCQLAGAAINRSILCDNVYVGPGSVIEESILLPGARVGRDCRLYRVIVEERVEISGGTSVGVDVMPANGLCELSDNGITVLYGFDEHASRNRGGRAVAGGTGHAQFAAQHRRAAQFDSNEAPSNEQVSKVSKPSSSRDGSFRNRVRPFPRRQNLQALAPGPRRENGSASTPETVRARIPAPYRHPPYRHREGASVGS